MAKILFGFGGIKLTDGTYTAEFSGASGILEFVPIQIVKENINYNIISRLLGFRLNIYLNEIYNVDDDDYVQYQYLIQIINSLVNSNGQNTITITPRNDSTITNVLSYECILASNVKPEDLHRFKLGQKINLKFQCINKINEIPYNVLSDTTANTYIDDVADTYVDENGDIYIDEQG